MEHSKQYPELQLQQQQQEQQPSRPALHTHFAQMSSLPLRTSSSTPISSPGLFNPIRQHNQLATTSVSESNTPAPTLESPYLHPLQTHKVRETHKALIDSDTITGRKSINQYEVIEEIGRGMHGKVKLARNHGTGENVAIKIIPRFSKKRRLGKVTAMSPQDKTKKEIAILKKIRHTNVVALLEVIDDPELKKIYMVLEHVELGEIVWRKKGLPHVCQYERRRIEREMRGEAPTSEEELYDRMLERRQAIRELKRAKMAKNHTGPTEYWSVEHGAAEDGSSVGPWSRISSREDFAAVEGSMSQPLSRRSSLAPTRSHSMSSSPGLPGPFEDTPNWNDAPMTPGPLYPAGLSASPLDGLAFGGYADDTFGFRERSPSMADSIISHMSSIDYNPRAHDPFADDFSYAPCFTFDQARSAFRDTVLGLEYLHYQGVVHRDIKPANLLWSRDHRVKISDFGVSYFGRPIRDGEPDDLVSESEAKDFDDDLELSKTVGTPAFFAPELCYTDPDKTQPKISEQIDVWSLGVTLYCLIYARIPFLAEDEFQMFRKIATEDVYIPRRRLKPVDPSTSPEVTSLYKRQNTYPYRDDNDLEYEDVDNLLYDLLRQMLIKNPEKRIRLRDIKRHPWVLQGIINQAAWLEDTDPARPSSGRKIQVDERDLSAAVVPLTFLERARSVVKKAVGKVMHPLVDRSDSRSRRRATSSAASSAGESVLKTGPPTPQFPNERRRSIHPDENTLARAVENLALADAKPDSSVTDSTQSETVAYDPMATVLPPLPDVGSMNRGRSHSELGEAAKADARSSSSRLLTRNVPLRVRRSQHFLNMAPHLSGPQTVPGTPFYDGHQDLQWDVSNRSQDIAHTSNDTSRSQSMDRNIFISPDKRAAPQVSLNTSIAPGNIQAPRSMRPMRSIDLGRGRYNYEISSSPLSLSPQSVPPNYQHRQPQSDPNFQFRSNERPLTAHRIENTVEIRSPLTRTPVTASPDAEDNSLPRGVPSAEGTWSTLPPTEQTSPRYQFEAPSRGDTIATYKTASSDSIDHLGTPLTSPSETASPMAACQGNDSTSQRMLAFQSDPSLPALLSGASSVSADLEGELLGRPGIVSTHPSLLETRDSLTPPALAKEPVGGFPINQVFENPPAMDSGSLAVPVKPAHTPTSHLHTGTSHLTHNDEDDEDASDDEFLLMAKAKKRPPVVSKGRPFEARRRDTNISTASDETAKKVNIHSES